MSLRAQGRWAAIILSFIIALSLAIMPLPHAMENWRPEWTTLVLIYWCMALPQRVGVGVGWLAGLTLDVLRSGLLGQQALALAIVAYLTLQFHRRLRVFPLWQQCLSVFTLIAMQEVIQLWTTGLSSETGPLSGYLLPPLSSLFIWPVIFTVLRLIRRRQHIR